MHWQWRKSTSEADPIAIPHELYVDYFLSSWITQHSFFFMASKVVKVVHMFVCSNNLWYRVQLSNSWLFWIVGHFVCVYAYEWSVLVEFADVQITTIFSHTVLITLYLFAKIIWQRYIVHFVAIFVSEIRQMYTFQIKFLTISEISTVLNFVEFNNVIREFNHMEI